jgi:hypothetical protein
MSNDRADGLEGVWAPIVIFASAAVLFLVAWALWFTHNEKAQGAAITLVGVMATHLVKEIQQLLRSWLRDDSPTRKVPEPERNSAVGNTTPDR